MSQVVVIDYTNWRGERIKRRVQPIEIWWGETNWHPGNQWLLKANDVDIASKDPDHIPCVKDFAMSGIHGWERTYD